MTTTHQLLDELTKSKTRDLSFYCDIWRNSNHAEWQTGLEIYRLLGDCFLRLGEPLLAFDVTNEALSIWPDDAGLLTRQSLALARSGASERANVLLRQLYERGQVDEETIGLLARTHKDLWQSAGDAGAGQRHLQQSIGFYAEAYRRYQGYWTGINAATLSRINRDKDHAEALAREVQAVCQATLRKSGAEQGQFYWLYATLGEASLVLGEFHDAAAWYDKAASLPEAGLGDLATTRRNALLLLQATGRDPRFLRDCLPVPQVIVFTGHRIDVPGQQPARFPPECEDPVRARIDDYLARLNKRAAKLGFASAACGADILFLEAMQKIGAITNIVLPASETNFIRHTVDRVPGSDWKSRFAKVMQYASHRTIASEEATSGVSFAYANLLLYGLAKSRARHVAGDLNALAVWDEAPGLPGGTGSAIKLWRDCGQQVEIIHPQSGATKGLAAADAAAAPGGAWQATILDDAAEHKSKLVSIFFADVMGYSKLIDPQVPRFVERFLGAIAEQLERATPPPLVRNTWGDALYFVFDDVRSAGLLALDVAELVGKTDWPAHGLPKNMNIRIALHSGPAFRVEDPIIRQINYTSVHTSRTARMEPITPPGSVYCSEAFAAVVEAAGVDEFVCDYVGQTVLAKGYGVFPTYRVRRAFISEQHSS